MLKKIVVFLFAASVCAFAYSQKVNIIPAPASVTELNEEGFSLNQKTVLYIDTKGEEMEVAKFLQESFSSAFGTKLRTIDKKKLKNKALKNAIIFVRVSDKTLKDEGYQLDINKDKIVVQANENAGFFYALQSICQLSEGQLLPGHLTLWQDEKINSATTSITLPSCSITDYPRFAYRGKHFDPARHFFTIDQVKRHIDLMAYHKLNTLHFHLTDDQGWRVEIKRYPKLQSVASVRSGTIIGHYNDNDQRNPNYDGVPHGGYYTQKELKELVEYAKARNIEIIPEIDLPGHASAALTAYPYLGCKGEGYKVQGTWGVFEEVFCTKDSVLEFFKGVFDELIEIFPSRYIHIGGDECPKTNWKSCPKCQEQIKLHGLKDEKELQSWFMHSLQAYLESKGRKIIAWDELLEGGAAEGATIMSWQGESGGEQAAKAGLDAIMSPAAYLYFDYYQGEPECEPLAIGGYTPLKKVYLYEPVPRNLTKEQAMHIIGVQANTWTEYIPTYTDLQYMDFPRIAALCEIAWSKAENKNYDCFLARLETLFKSYDKMNVNYSRSHYTIGAEVSFNTSLQSPEVTLTSVAKGADIFYSLDTCQNKHFVPYTQSIVIDRPTTLTAYAEREGNRVSPIFTTSYFPNKATGKPYTIENLNPQYTGSTKNALTDALVGSQKSYDKWVGTYGYDYCVIVDLQTEQEISEISINFLENVGSWIFLPLSVEFSTGLQQDMLEPIEATNVTISQNGQIQNHHAKFPKRKARFVKIFAKSIKQCPANHPGAGYPAHVFGDEVIVN
ncbi:MAG: family 20 glycosylhydrolase [Candidatus Onthomorpha sp.]|nr:family 20 glycosylhydrolase [Candidatus Onthomorpha sp.]